MRIDLPPLHVFIWVEATYKLICVSQLQPCLCVLQQMNLQFLQCCEIGVVDPCLGYSPDLQSLPTCLYILSADTHHTVSKFDPPLRRNAKSRAAVFEQAQALDAAHAHMLGVSEQATLAELATELAEARAAFMEQHSGSGLYAMTGLECVQKRLAVWSVDLPSCDTQ